MDRNNVVSMDADNGDILEISKSDIESMTDLDDVMVLLDEVNSLTDDLQQTARAFKVSGCPNHGLASKLAAYYRAQGWLYKRRKILQKQNEVSDEVINEEEE